MVVDCFTYNGEIDILKLRLEVLYDHVDKFIIVEAKTTFSGNEKPLHFLKQEQQFRKWWPKIEHFTVSEDYSREETLLAKHSPNTQGARHWRNEFLQKESIKKALWHLNEEDVVYIGDVDEIWDWRYVPEEGIHKLKLRVYAYWLDYRSNEEFWGPIVCRWKDIKNECLNHVRSDTRYRTQEYRGWHFTSMGGLEEVRRKLNDSYTPESYNTVEVQALLPHRLKQRRDYLGRPFLFEEDDSEWPVYLKKNKVEYKHLCLPEETT